MILDHIRNKYDEIHERVLFWISYDSSMKFVSTRSADHVYFDYYSLMNDIVHVDVYSGGTSNNYRTTMSRSMWEINYSSYIENINSRSEGEV